MAVDSETKPAGPAVSGAASSSDADLLRRVALATAAVLAVAALAFGLWQARSIVILLLLALTFAAAIRPGVEWLRRQNVPEPGAIFVFFVLVLGAIAFFCWLAVPPALHQIAHALSQGNVGDVSAGPSAGARERTLAWLQQHLQQLPTGSQLLHPVATYGHKLTDAVVAIFFTLAATWYWVSERDRMIGLIASLMPEAKRDKARETLLAIDSRLGRYTRLRFAMIFAIGATLSLGFYVVG
jgi:predicted PurR-regulated permease PerM